MHPGEISDVWVRVVAAACLVCAAVTTLPQTFRLIRHPDHEGVSGSAVVFQAVSEAAWLAYAVLAHRMPAVPADTLYAAGGLALLAALVVAGGVRPGQWLWGGAWALVLTTAALHPGMGGRYALMGELLGLAVLVEGIPQVGAAWRSPTASGVSAGTQILLVVGAGLWGVYGLFVGDRPFMTYAALQVAVTTPVLVRLSVRRRATPTTRPAASS
jgi:uncharacterized protein with PQ loop repeat